MSFTDLLRASRSGKTSVLHKFLTHYDPRSHRLYAFVEGDPDQSFYRLHLEKFAIDSSNIFTYNCEGKARVYEVYQAILSRFPRCDRALFFVDKDVDDIIGKTWPADPRIFVTDTYSIENYVICPEAVRKYFRDFVKVRRVDIDMDLILNQFHRQAIRFHSMVLPIMAWIVVMRRSGNHVNLNNVDLGRLFVIRDGEIARLPRRRTMEYLQRVTQTENVRCDWRSVRATCRELRRFVPKKYVRGKFEAWWFLSFINKVCEDIKRIAAEENGSFSPTVQLQQGAFIQLLGPAAPPPPVLETFLSFHLARHVTSQESEAGDSGSSRLARMLGFIRVVRRP